MRLTIERLTQLSHHDRLDLAKIWLDDDLTQLEPTLNDVQHLYVARFNDRLLGAVLLTVNGSEGVLSKLEIREATRRRGVGQYLLQEIIRQMPIIQQWRLTEDKSADPQVMAVFMQHCGFHRQGETWIYLTDEQ